VRNAAVEQYKVSSELRRRPQLFSYLVDPSKGMSISVRGRSSASTHIFGI
jgi:hypothetical protein